MAIPACQKVRSSSQDKAMLNKRQLSAAADHTNLGNGISVVASDKLVGATNYVKAVNTVAGETYPSDYTQGIAITIIGIAAQRTVTYAP